MTPNLLGKLREITGDQGLITATQDMAPFVTEPRSLFHHRPQCIVLPHTTDQVADIVRLCGDFHMPIIPQGGNTGLCGGAVPTADGQELILSLNRMDRIREIDTVNNTLTAEAGCIVAKLRDTAEHNDRLFPLRFGADGSARIGGSISANSGGTNVLRYGNARELVLGLEVVLANGEVWNGLGGLRKDNTGYDLKNLFIGSEGTLGIVTAATLKLFPLPVRTATAWVAVGDIGSATGLLNRLQSRSGGAVSGCELVSHTGLSFAVTHIPGCRYPFQTPCPWYLLVELTSGMQDDNLEELLLAVLQEQWEGGTIQDVVVATSSTQRDAFWRLREAVAEAQTHEGGSIKHDVSVPISRIAELIERTLPLVEKELPGIRPCIFGHLGDGNLHFNLSQPVGDNRERFLSLWGTFNRIVHDQVHALGGSISAEHGIGQLKTGELIRYKDAVALRLMKQLKQALDPQHLLNPGKVTRD